MAKAAAEQGRVHCGGCRAVLRIPPEKDRARLRCPRCGAPLLTELVVGELFGPYQVLSVIDRGGMGEVALAVDRESGRRVALKVLSERVARRPEDVTRFRREGRLGSLLDHPNVVACYQCARQGERWYLAMELVTGGDADRLLKRRGRLPWPEVLSMARELSEALALMAELGVIHRDIKPRNIMLDAEGHPKLADFGLGKVVGHDADASGEAEASLTLTGTQMGTPAYMPPEQIEDAMRATPAADVYAFGASLFALLTADRPFPGKNAVAVAHAVLEQRPPRVSDLVPDVAPALDELVDWCLAKRPEQRPPDGRRLRELLDQVIADPQGRQAIRDARRVRQHGIAWWLYAAIAVGVGGLAAVVYGVLA